MKLERIMDLGLMEEQLIELFPDMHVPSNTFFDDGQLFGHPFTAVSMYCDADAPYGGTVFYMRFFTGSNMSIMVDNAPDENWSGIQEETEDDRLENDNTIFENLKIEFMHVYKFNIDEHGKSEFVIKIGKKRQIKLGTIDVEKLYRAVTTED